MKYVSGEIKAKNLIHDLKKNIGSTEVCRAIVEKVKHDQFFSLYESAILENFIDEILTSFAKFTSQIGCTELKVLLYTGSTCNNVSERCSMYDENDKKFWNRHLELSIGVNIYLEVLQLVRAAARVFAPRTKISRNISVSLQLNLEFRSSKI